MISDGLKFAGDVNIESVSISSTNGFTRDVTNQVAQIEFYEDMFAPFTTGTLVVVDALDLVNLFPFVGEEYIKFRISTPSFDEKSRVIDTEYYIFKMSERININDKTQAYALHFISKEALVDLNVKLSRSFQGVSSEIANELIYGPDGLGTVKPANIETATNKIRFVSNFWSPVTCLNYLSKVAVSDQNNSSYLFFENRSGFNFVTLNELYNAETFVDFIYDNKPRDFLAQGQTVMNPQEQYKRISEFTINQSFDYINRIESGMYASKMISHDFVSKKYSVNNYNLLKDFPNHEHLNKFPVASSRVIVAPNALQMTEQKHWGVFTDYNDITNTRFQQQRISLLKQAESFKLQIVVPGRTDYTVGRKVNVTLYKTQPASKEENLDDLVDTLHSGNYLISAINHVIDREKHECHMELIKDSMVIDLERGGR